MLQETDTALEIQWPDDVIEFSSQYGSEGSLSYCVKNLSQGVQTYPNYGDFTEAAVWRTYGKWWTDLKKRKRAVNADQHFISQDYVDLLYKHDVWPQSVNIYETYNPGAVVRILACDRAPADLRGAVDHVRWFVLWSGIPQTHLPPRSRIFFPPLWSCPFPTRLIRIELNQNHCSYYTELDSVSLCGYRKRPIGYKQALREALDDLLDDPSTAVKQNRENIAQQTADIDEPKTVLCVECGEPCSKDCCTAVPIPTAHGDAPTTLCSCCARVRHQQMHTFSDDAFKQWLPQAASNDSKDQVSVSTLERIAKDMSELHLKTSLTDALPVSDNAHFDALPDEVIQLIISFLDSGCISRLACVSHLFRKHCYDPLLYVDVDLQPYWHQVTDHVLGRLTNRCQHLQILNLSWCGAYNAITAVVFVEFLRNACRDLKVLKLSSCSFVTDECVQAIAQGHAQLQELDLSSCLNVTAAGLEPLAELRNLVMLNVYRTHLANQGLCAIIRNNSNLEDLNVGSCRAINGDNVSIALAQHCKNLKVLDFWRCSSLGVDGLRQLVNSCSQLQQLDVGWCSQLKHADPLFQDMAKKCPDIQKLFLTAHRSVSDSDVLAFAEFLPNLRQLDLLGTNRITEPSINILLEKCPKLQLLDISFCYKITDETVRVWRANYPHVNIKRSYQKDADA